MAGGKRKRQLGVLLTVLLAIAAAFGVPVGPSGQPLVEQVVE